MGWHGSWAAFLLAAFVAEVIGTMAGFGSATILTPIAALFVDVKTAIALVACFHLFGNASRLIFFGRRVDWKIWAQFGITGVLCSFLGAHVTALLASSMVKGLFGVFLLCYVAFSWRTAGQIQFSPNRTTLVIGGMTSGFMAGLLGTGGAIRSVCLLAFGMPRESYIGTSAAIAFMVDATRLPVYLSGRLLPASLILILAGLMATAFAGSFLGQWLLHRLSARGFRSIVTVVLTILGVKLVMESLPRL